MRFVVWLSFLEASSLVSAGNVKSRSRVHEKCHNQAVKTLKECQNMFGLIQG